VFRGRGDKKTLDVEFLECSENLPLCKKLASLTIDQCFGQNGLISRVEMRILWDIDLSISGYAKLGKAVTHFVNRLTVNRLNDGSSKSLFEELDIKKPGPKIRKLLVKRRKAPFDIGKQTTCTTFFRITEINYIGNETFSEILQVWTWSGFSNRQKSFLFKFYNNLLGINTRTWHFAGNGTRNCLFCSVKNPPIVTDETFLHLFYNCPTVASWHQNFIRKCFPDMTFPTALEERILWFLGIYSNSVCPFITAACLTFQYCIWECKLKKKSPSFNTLFAEFLFLFKETTAHNSSIRDSGSVLNYELCRIIFGGGRRIQDGE
jgi:hypothetical protein